MTDDGAINDGRGVGTACVLVVVEDGVRHVDDRASVFFVNTVERGIAFYFNALVTDGCIYLNLHKGTHS